MKQKVRERVLSLDSAQALRQFAGALVFALLTAVGAWLAIPTPLSPVPLTMQTLFVGLSGAWLGSRWGAASQGLYLFMGICGLPMFAGGLSGFAIVAGTSGGYLLAFPVAAWLTGWLSERMSSFVGRCTAFFVGSLPILVLGTAQLSLISSAGFAQAMGLGVIPFLAGDFIKSVVGASVIRLRSRQSS